jgi:hypothetical protein
MRSFCKIMAWFIGSHDAAIHNLMKNSSFSVSRTMFVSAFMFVSLDTLLLKDEKSIMLWNRAIVDAGRLEDHVDLGELAELLLDALEVAAFNLHVHEGDDSVAELLIIQHRNESLQDTIFLEFLQTVMDGSNGDPVELGNFSEGNPCILL